MVVIPENYIPTDQECAVGCGTLFRHPHSDVGFCENWHSRYLGPQEKPIRYILRKFRDDEYQAWTENRPAWTIWDTVADEPVLDRATDEYAWDLSESRARSWFNRLDGPKNDESLAS